MTDCPICYTSYDSETHVPMSLEYGHTYGYKCLTDLRQPRCPSCAKPVDMSKARKVYDLIPNKPPAPLKSAVGNTKITCPNGHPTIWSGKSSECRKDFRIAPGWKCDQCKFHQCDECCKTQFNSKSCPNGHIVEWFGRLNEIHTCAICNKKRVSRQCRKCNNMHCAACGTSECDASITKLKELDKQCTISDCYNYAYWRCNFCQLGLCNKCGGTKLYSQKCPNNHATTWTGEKHLCSHCKHQRPGRKCFRCNYSLCDACGQQAPIKHGANFDKALCCCTM